MLFAVNNVVGFRPAACSDRFDAMDLFPVDTVTTRGGDNTLDILDLIRELFRVNNIDMARPVRTSRGGVCPVSGGVGATGLESVRRGTAPAIRPAASASLVLGAIERTASGLDRMPVYLQAAEALSRVAVTFAVGDGRSALRFVEAPGVAPSLANDSQPGVVAAAWLQGVSASVGERLLLGYVEGPAGTLANARVMGASAASLEESRKLMLTAPSAPELQQ